MEVEIIIASSSVVSMTCALVFPVGMPVLRFITSLTSLFLLPLIGTVLAAMYGDREAQSGLVALLMAFAVLMRF